MIVECRYCENKLFLLGKTCSITNVCGVSIICGGEPFEDALKGAINKLHNTF